jgi:hypothetical protein
MDRSLALRAFAGIAICLPILACGGRVDGPPGPGDQLPTGDVTSQSGSTRSGATSAYVNISTTGVSCGASVDPNFNGTCTYSSNNTYSTYTTTNYGTPTTWAGTVISVSGTYSTTVAVTTSYITGTTTVANQCAGLPIPPPTACADGSYATETYAFINGACVLELLCPAPNSCSPGAACVPGSGCGSTGGPGACSFSCTCDPSGHLGCTETCSSSSSLCAQGATCAPNNVCKLAPVFGNQCALDCKCNASGTYDCASCGTPVPTSGCAQWAPCAVEGELCANNSGTCGCECRSGNFECVSSDPDAGFVCR